jgi:glycosyltransferase involved in cell wall biosynthesis
MSAPAISVIVPTHGRPTALGRCVDSLLTQHLPGESPFEVIVVDDGSPEPVRLSDAAGARGVRVIRQPQQGPAAARNTGLGAATGEIVAFIDDDCEASPGWLTAILQTSRANPGAGCGGFVVNRLRDNPFAETSQLIVTFLREYYQTLSSGIFFTSNNLAFPRLALIEQGGFDVTYTRAAGEDRELCDRWVELGGRIVAAPDAVVQHAHPLTLAGFCRQHFEYGRGAWDYRRARAARAGAPVRIEPWAFYRDLLCYPVHIHGARGVALSALVGLAQSANAAGFFVEAVRSRLA